MSSVKYRATIGSALVGFGSASLTSCLLIAARLLTDRREKTAANNRLLISMSALANEVDPVGLKLLAAAFKRVNLV